MTSHLVNGLIICAGKSGRMGSFKPLMDYNGKTFLQNVISNLDLICSRIIVVTGYNSEQLKKSMLNTLKKEKNKNLTDKISFVENKDFEKGMFTSLQKGLSEIWKLNLSEKSAHWVLYHFVDQPGLPVEFYHDFIGQIDNTHNWIQPSYDNRGGHPILLRSDVADYLLNSNEGSNLRELSQNSLVIKKRWACYYKNVLQDLDTQQDYLASIDPFA